MSTFRKPPFWATTLTLAGVGVLCTLGTWQLHRLEWKENLLERINSYDSTDLQEIPLNALTAENEFLKGQLNGRYLFDREIAIKPRTFDGKPGAHIITPFALDDQSTILINRGWVPLDQDWRKDGSANADVILRVPRKPNMFVPPNTPAKDEWYSLNIEEIAQVKELNNVLPVMAYLLADESAEQSYPDASALTIDLNNNHLQYAFFWYAMALIMVSVYVLRFIKPA